MLLLLLLLLLLLSLLLLLLLLLLSLLLLIICHFAVVHVFLFLNTEALSFLDSLSFARHADVMKKIIQTVADGGGGELGVHMYPTLVAVLW